MRVYYNNKMSPKELTIGFSPCPNDTFIFYALTHGKIDTGGTVIKPVIEDVEALNRKALDGELDASKISFHAFAHIAAEYAVLRSGAALGKGCGPLVVARELLFAGPGALKGKTVAIPGGLTTAYLLLMLYEPGFRDPSSVKPMPFNEIMPAVREGRADAGLVIHEGRFTYRNYGLLEVLDLGRWWEGRTGLPIPLGGIAAKRSLGKGLLHELEGWIRRSVLYTLQRPEEAREFIRSHAQEMDEEVQKKHIGLYVNENTVWMDKEGEGAVSFLMEKAAEAGVAGKAGLPGPVFIE